MLPDMSGTPFGVRKADTDGLVPEDHKLAWWLILILVIGGILILILSALSFYLYRWRKRINNSEEEPPKPRRPTRAEIITEAQETNLEDLFKEYEDSDDETVGML